MSIFHWIVLLIPVAVGYGIYRFAKSQPPVDASPPSGVGGWLMFLVLGFTLLWPLFNAGQTMDVLVSAEKQTPALLSRDSWATYKSACWWLVLCVSILSVYAGLGLARGRNRAVVRRAIAVLWVNGPVAALIMGTVIPATTYGQLLPIGAIASGVAFSSIAAGVWTAYLMKSKRVRATYG